MGPGDLTFNHTVKVGESMDFGTKGRAWSVWIILSLLAIVGTAGAQEGAGSDLPLVVPSSDDITVELRATSRGPGLLLTWPEPDDALSTSVALVDTAGLGIPITITGDYADRFDRNIVFSFTTGGSVGDTNLNRMVCQWRNLNNILSGNLAGELNLSNTGGLWVRHEGNWSRRNGGLPPYLPYTNLVDLAVATSGDMAVVMASGSPPQVTNDPVGVFLAAPEGDWRQVGQDVFTPSRRLNRIAIDPANANNIAVGSQRDGLFLSTDGGETFSQWTSDLDPSAPNIPTVFEVTALRWTTSRLYVAIRNYGLFIRESGATSFDRIEDLEVPAAPGSETIIRPVVNTVEEDPADPQRILVGMTSHGVWASDDGGVTWQSRLVDYDGPTEGWAVSVRSLAVDPENGARIILGTVAQVIRYTIDGGATWNAADTPYDDQEIKPEIWRVLYHPGRLLALADGIGLLESVDQGLTWSLVADQPYNRGARDLESDGQDLLVPTTGGGIYTADTEVLISDTILPGATDDDLEDLDIGLTISFGEGSLTLVDGNDDGALDQRDINLICQDYQGWIVWRSPRGNPDEMVMIGRYDKNNPESCIEGFCGDENFVLLPNCFSERRAACFDLSVPGQVSFYDDDIFNGFTYQYAITPFDLGDISDVRDPVSIDNPLVFPDRFAGDQYGIGDGPGNRFSIQINTEAAMPEGGEEIYAYPNPLRLGTGIVGGEGEEVVWTNLPPDSRIQVFTLAGDEIAELPRDGSPQEGGNMYWVARNEDNRLLASGIYIWRVIMPDRGDFWGKLVIIN